MQPPSQDIDKLTLELLINKNQYKKYLSKTDPEKFKTNQEHLEKINKYRGKIMTMFSQLLDNPDKQITTSINEDFDHFVKTCICHFEMKEIEKQDSYSYEKDDDEDMLFGNCETHIYNNNHDDQHDEYEDENEMLCEKNHSKTKSFWGKPIIKKGNPTLPNGYTMDMFVKSSKR
jgi:sugar-specific transcriptional regulator TrmB